MKNNTIINRNNLPKAYKAFTIHQFHMDNTKRDDLSLGKVDNYENELVVISEVHDPRCTCWGDLMYSVIPLCDTNKEFLVYHNELWQGKKINLVKRNNYSILSSDIFQFNRDELRDEYIESYGAEPDEDELYRFADSFIEHYWFETIAEIERYENIHGGSDYIVLANIGRWNGHYASSDIITGMENVLYKCLNKMDDYEVYFKNGQLIIDGKHHDGVNRFIVRELKDGSADYIEKWQWDLEEEELHHNLFYSSRWSMRPKMFDILNFMGF